jgi:GMP synthase (glutamine-hydrolysing)
MKAFVIQHLHFENLGNLQPALLDAGYSVEYFDAVNPEHLDKIETTVCDLLIILGGPIGVYEEDSYPFLTQEKRIIKKRIEKKQPLIGICLGAQLIASTLGAKVYPGDTKEIGWKTITSTSDIEFSSLNQQRVLHWHGDTFDLPEGAERIFSSELYPNQGFTYGENVLALQFHIEVQPHRIEEWLVGHACEISSLKTESVKKIRHDTQTYAPLLQGLAKGMWTKWLSSQVN